MSFFADEQVLTERFVNGFASTHPNVRVDMPGQTTAPDGKTYLVRFRVGKFNDSKQIGMSGDTKTYRNYGTVMVQIIGPADKGSGGVLQLADDVAELFRSWRQGGMVCQTPSIGTLVEEKITVANTVTIPYQSTFSK